MTANELELAFENAPTLDDKEKVLNSAIIEQLNTFVTAPIDLIQSDEFVKLDESIKNLYDEFRFLQVDKQQEENNRCEEEIQEGKYQLYTCLKEIPDFKCNVGDYKYIKIDDIASDYKSKGVDQISPEMADYVANIEPIITIISDNSIGSLKFKKIFTKKIGDFNDYFVKL